MPPIYTCTQRFWYFLFIGEGEGHFRGSSVSYVRSFSISVFWGGQGIFNEKLKKFIILFYFFFLIFLFFSGERGDIRGEGPFSPIGAFQFSFPRSPRSILSKIKNTNLPFSTVFIFYFGVGAFGVSSLCALRIFWFSFPGNSNSI